MKLQKKLDRLGAIKTKELDYKEVNYIAHYVTDKITDEFLILQTQYNEILAKLLNCKMYYAKIPDNISKVNYIYEEDSIYIDENINILEENEQLFHEIIHYLQVLRKNNKKIERMGLCKFGEFAIRGLGINEAVVQYMASRIMKNEKEPAQMYGIKLETISPKSYPILTNLIEQLIYLIGEDEIIQYSMNVNEKFEDLFYNTFEEKGNYIIKNFDKILEIKNKLYLENNRTIQKELQEKINTIYFDTQKSMLVKYYNQSSSRLTDLKEVDEHIGKFLNNKDILGISEKEKLNFYEEYKTVIMNKFNKQIIKINKKTQRKALIVYNNKIKEFWQKTISYFFN